MIQSGPLAQILMLSLAEWYVALGSYVVKFSFAPFAWLTVIVTRAYVLIQSGGTS